MRAVITSSKITPDLYVTRISKVVNEEMANEKIFRKALPRTKIIRQITKLMKKFTPEEFLAIDDADFKRRIGKLMANQLVAGMLSDLTPEEMCMFDEAVAEK